jgi:replicative superfamily II helicase
MVKSLGNDKNIFTNFSSIVQRAEELLAIMQHHDGITATSKSYIEKLFKDRMINSSK